MEVKPFLLDTVVHHLMVVRKAVPSHQSVAEEDTVGIWLRTELRFERDIDEGQVARERTPTAADVKDIDSG